MRLFPSQLWLAILRNHYVALVRRSWVYGKGQHWKFLLVVVMFVLANLLLMLEPYVIGQLLNTIQLGGPDMLNRALWHLVTFTSLTFGFWALHGPARILERSYAFYVYRTFQQHTYGVLTHLPLKWHREHHSGETIDKVQKASQALRSFNDEHYNYIETMVRFCASLVAIVIIVPLYGILALGAGLVIALLIFRFNAKIVLTVKEMNTREHAVSAMLYDYLGNIFTIITLRLQDLTQKEWVQRLGNVFPVFRRNILLNEVKWGLVSIFLSLMNFALLALYIIQHVVTGRMLLVGDLITLYQYLGKFIEVFFRVSSQFEKILWANTNASLLDAVLQDSERRSLQYPPPAMPWHRIQVSGLRFSYQDSAHREHHLQDMHVDLRPGLKIAFVGESGSGKSTFLALLRGLEDPESVQLQIDEQTYDALSPLSGITTLIPQNPELFDHSLEYNITAGIPYPIEEITKVCQLSCFDTVLETLPHGLHTQIRERGVNLSGGQKQRLALARGLLSAQGSSILLLDEPTSSVDAINEVKIYRNIFAEFTHATVISSIHRLNLLSLFDEVYVLSAGKIVEHGPVLELLEKPYGKLAGMWANYQKHLQEAQKA